MTNVITDDHEKPKLIFIKYQQVVYFIIAVSKNYEF